MAQEVYIFPLLNNADIHLVGRKYDFHLGLRVVSLDEAAAKVVEQSLDCPAGYEGLFGTREEREGGSSSTSGDEDRGWAIVVPMPERNTQFEEQGISRLAVAEVIAEGFCSAMRVLMCGDVDAPQAFRSKFDDDGSLAVEPLKDKTGDVVGDESTDRLPDPQPDIDDPHSQMYSDDPRFILGCAGTMRGTSCALRDEHVEPLDQVWRGIVRLRGLDNLAQAFSELSFRRLDVKIRKGRPQGKELPPKEYAERLRGKWEKYLSQTQNKSRLGRALTLFEHTMMMPAAFHWSHPGSELPLFLQAVIVLETLFACREGDVGRTVATRAARLLAGGTGEMCQESFRAVGEEDEERDPRKNLYEKILKLYQARNDIMHGHKEFDAVDDTIKARAWKIAAWSLQRVLGTSDSEAFKILAGLEKTDAERKRVQQFWRDLELS